MDDYGINRCALTSNTAGCSIHEEVVELSCEELMEEEAKADDEHCHSNNLAFRQCCGKILWRDKVEGASE
jgi:hypothetical protein